MLAGTKGALTKEDTRAAEANRDGPGLAGTGSHPTCDEYDRQNLRKPFLLKFDVTTWSLSIFYRRAFAPGTGTEGEGGAILALTSCGGKKTQIQLTVIQFDEE